MGATIAFGGYHLIQRIGSGGMAEVWTATRAGGKQTTLAVKQLLPHLTEDPQLVEMFLAEAHWLVRLAHPNIVRFVEFGEVEGTYYLAMEHVNGKNLRALLATIGGAGPPAPGLGALVLHRVCSALAYVHEMTDASGRPLRLVHRDVSPSNVMLGYDGSVKLVDFGIAKALADTAARTRTGLRKGTPSYMAPEHVDGRPVDHRSDVFSAGVVLHEALTGQRLFKGHGESVMAELVKGRAIPPPSTVNPDVPASLDRICLRAAARDPDERFATAREMAGELAAVVAELGWTTRDLASAVKRTFPQRSHDQPDVRTATVELVKRAPRRRLGWPLIAAFVLLVIGPATVDTDRLGSAPEESARAERLPHLAQPSAPPAALPDAGPTKNTRPPSSPALMIPLPTGTGRHPVIHVPRRLPTTSPRATDRARDAVADPLAKRR